MKKFLTVHILVSFHLLIIASVITVAVWSVHVAQDNFLRHIEEDIDQQVVRLTELFIRTDENGAFPAIAEIIVDCPKRGKFDALLTDVEALSSKEMLELQQLFEGCGAFYAERKVLMVSRIEREIVVLTDLIHLYDALKEGGEMRYKLTVWTALYEKEQTRSEYFTELADVQKQIISALSAGKSVYTQEVQELLSNAHELQRLLSVLDTEIDTARKTIIE